MKKTKKTKIFLRTAISAILAITLICSVLLTATSCGNKPEEVKGGHCEYLHTRNTEGHELKYVKISVKNHGAMIVLLDRTLAPKTVDNFLKLTNEGFYDGLTFHRIISGFVIQGGDPKADGTGGSPDKIEGEFVANGYWNDLGHIEGVISMARSNDMNSASSQFFICNADARSSLDYKYAGFGYVIAGLDVVHSITSATVGYADSSSGTIANKKKQAVITEIIEITEEEALSYTANEEHSH